MDTAATERRDRIRIIVSRSDLADFIRGRLRALVEDDSRSFADTFLLLEFGLESASALRRALPEVVSDVCADSGIRYGLQISTNFREQDCEAELHDWWAQEVSKSRGEVDILVLISPAEEAPRRWSRRFPDQVLRERFLQQVCDACLRAVRQNLVAARLGPEYAQYQERAVDLAFDEGDRQRPDAIDVYLSLGIDRTAIEDLIRTTATSVWAERDQERQVDIVRGKVDAWLEAQSPKLPNLLVISIGSDDESCLDDLGRVDEFFFRRKVVLEQASRKIGKRDCGPDVAVVTDGALGPGT